MQEAARTREEVNCGFNVDMLPPMYWIEMQLECGIQQAHEIHLRRVCQPRLPTLHEESSTDLVAWLCGENEQQQFGRLILSFLQQSQYLQPPVKENPRSKLSSNQSSCLSNTSPMVKASGKLQGVRRNGLATA